MLHRLQHVKSRSSIRIDLRPDFLSASCIVLSQFHAALGALLDLLSRKVGGQLFWHGLRPRLLLLRHGQLVGLGLKSDQGAMLSLLLRRCPVRIDCVFRTVQCLPGGVEPCLGCVDLGADWSWNLPGNVGNPVQHRCKTICDLVQAIDGPSRHVANSLRDSSNELS